MRSTLRAIVPALVAVCAASVSGDEIRESTADQARRSVVLNAVSAGLENRYDCRNVDSGSTAAAISIDEADPQNVVVSVNCEGGPTVRAKTILRDDRLHEPIYGMDFEYEAAAGEIDDSGIDRQDHLHELVRNDAVLNSVYPALAGLISGTCQTVEDGVFENRWPGEERYLLEKDRVHYVLRCRSGSTTHSFEFAGVYNDDDDAIDWHSIRKGWSGF